MLKVYATLGGLALAFYLGWSIGGKLVENKWNEAENKALEEQIELTNKALAARDLLQADIENALLRLTESEAARLTLSNRLQEEIDREPIIRTITREVPADCPVCACPVIDAGPYFRLWNRAIRREAGSADIPAITASTGHDSLWPACLVAGLDGDY